MKIIFINPGNLPKSGRDLYDGDLYTSLSTLNANRGLNFGIPLALTTLAAITPGDHEIKIVDEMIDPIDFEENCDLVCLTAMTCKATRAYQIAAAFRKRRIKVIMGGIHASMRPDEALKHVDCVVEGEAEDIWPEVIKDFESNTLQRQYSCASVPDISKLPPPRHELTRYDNYFATFVQTSRGCPFSCKFCTVTEFSGKTLRKKSVEQVIDEVDAIVKLCRPRLTVIDTTDIGRRKKLARKLFFTDDNFAIDRKHALNICKALTDYQNANGIILNWFTQVNYKIGLDDELLSALRKAGCLELFMGFESLDPDALDGMNKTMNKPELYVESIKNVKRYGMEVVFSTIIGSDADTFGVDEQLAQFIEKNNVFYVLPNILTPFPGTRLSKELENTGRIIEYRPECYNTRNVVFRPKLMQPAELQRAYTKFCERIFSIDNMLKRGTRSLLYSKQNYMPPVTRIIVLLLFIVTATRVALQGRLSFLNLFKLLIRAPRMILVNGGISTLGILAISADYDTFAKSEVKRFADANFGTCQFGDML